MEGVRMPLVTAKRFTLNEYHRLVELGFFTECDRVELIHGEIIQMAAKGTAHTTCCRNLLRELSRLVIGVAELQCQDPITLSSGSEPEPDFVLARMTEDHYLSGHPTPEDIFLVIEIADSSLEYDRNVKMPLYAEAKIPYYWLFDVVEDCLEAYSNPYQDSHGNFGYSLKKILLPHQSIEIPSFNNLRLELSAIFPLR
jgi:Uma2 family endonuclease